MCEIHQLKYRTYIDGRNVRLAELQMPHLLINFQNFVCACVMLADGLTSLVQS